MYIRKTKDIYIIYWNNEEIENAETIKEARRLKEEYKIAFGGGSFKIVKKRVKN